MATANPIQMTRYVAARRRKNGREQPGQLEGHHRARRRLDARSGPRIQLRPGNPHHAEEDGGKRKRPDQRFGHPSNRRAPARPRRVVDGDKAQPRESQPERVVGDEQPAGPHAIRRHHGAGSRHDGADSRASEQPLVRTRREPHPGRIGVHLASASTRADASTARVESLSSDRRARSAPHTRACCSGRWPGSGTSGRRSSPGSDRGTAAAAREIRAWERARRPRRPVHDTAGRRRRTPPRRVRRPRDRRPGTGSPSAPPRRRPEAVAVPWEWCRAPAPGASSHRQNWDSPRTRCTSVSGPCSEDTRCQGPAWAAARRRSTRSTPPGLRPARRQAVRRGISAALLDRHRMKRRQQAFNRRTIGRGARRAAARARSDRR